MQDVNWNDLRYLLAVVRGRRLSAAARLLGVDDTTVSRRLGTMERAAGRRLHHRLADGRLELTQAGQALAAIAERLERDIGLLETGHSASGAVAGVVRLTSVPFVVNRLLVPAANALLDRHPDLRIELIAEARDLSLTRREADMALRLARPRTGGLKVKARRVGLLAYAPYVAATADRPVSRLPWIAYEESMAQLPQARWIETEIRRGKGTAARLRVNDVETAIEAVAAGHGRSMLPRPVADRDERLRRVRPGRAGDEVTRELWLLIHSELVDLPRVRAVSDWIEATLSGRPRRRSTPAESDIVTEEKFA